MKLIYLRPLTEKSLRFQIRRHTQRTALVRGMLLWGFQRRAFLRLYAKCVKIVNVASCEIYPKVLKYKLEYDNF